MRHTVATAMSATALTVASAPTVAVLATVLSTTASTLILLEFKKGDYSIKETTYAFLTR